MLFYVKNKKKILKKRIRLVQADFCAPVLIYITVCATRKEYLWLRSNSEAEYIPSLMCNINKRNLKGGGGGFHIGQIKRKRYISSSAKEEQKSG